MVSHRLIEISFFVLLVVPPLLLYPWIRIGMCSNLFFLVRYTNTFDADGRFCNCSEGSLALSADGV